MIQLWQMNTKFWSSTITQHLTYSFYVYKSEEYWSIKNLIFQDSGEQNE